MKIVISPYSNSKYITPGKTNAKNYPYWQEFINICKQNGHTISQVGVGNEVKFDNVDEYIWDKDMHELKSLITDFDIRLSVDNFFHHYCWYHNLHCFAIFSRSDPNIFGHKENINILKSRMYLRPDPFGVWHNLEFIKESFIEADKLYDTIARYFK